MEFSWTIKNNHIALMRGSTIVHPNAEEVFSLLDETGYTELSGITIPPIRDALRDVYFSSVGIPIKCSIVNGSENTIALKLYCLKSGKEIPVDIADGFIVDHCIFNNTWFYVNGNVEGLNNAFSKLEIKNINNISVKQFIGLIRNMEEIGLNTISNNVNWRLLNRDLPIDSIIPEGINANLYNYQKAGFFWMRYMIEQNQGCILGDEMGLGKTLQVITLLEELRSQNRKPSLVVAPVSLLQNWKNECKKFAPNMRVLIHHGSNRTGFFSVLENYDVVVVAYSTVVSDASLLSMINWEIVVLDEAQNIKNPSSKRTLFVKRIPRKSSVAVTGTPFENHVTDVWSIIDFVMPGLLGDIDEFNNCYSDDVCGAEDLEPIITPVILRRTVNEVAKDLPEKIVISQPIAMSDCEALQYEELRTEISRSADNGKIGIEALQRLRMFCTHPIICNYNFASEPFESSVKYQRFCEIIDDILSKKEKVIVFTSFNKMFEIIREDIKHRYGMDVDIINGSTPADERQEIVDKFNTDDERKVLILNPRAAGTGLNITSANHVIHYNLEWNPALEDQASARAYRRGQKKTVFIYRLYYENTVEQIVNERIEKKRNMSETAIVGTDGGEENKEDIIKAILMSPITKEG